MIANNLDEFIEVIMDSICDGLNNTKVGKIVTDELLKHVLKDDSEFTLEKWETTKHEFLTFLFFQILDSDDELRDEFMSHAVYEIQLQTDPEKREELN